MFPINWNDIFRKKDGTFVNMEDIGGGGSDLPEYSSADAGKVLSVDDAGELEWEELPDGGGKIYYKIWERSIYSDVLLAKFVDGAAASSGIHIASFDESYGGNIIGVDGYTPICAIAVDIYSGYQYMVGIQQTQDPARNYKVTFAIGNREITSGGCKVKVYYVKNEDLEVIN